MKTNLFTLIILVLLLSACGKGQPAQTPTPEVTEPVQETTDTGNEPYVPLAGSFLAVYEIGLGPNGYIALINFTNVPSTTKGQYLCQESECFTLPDAIIEAGGRVKIAVGEGDGLENVIATKATIGELKPSDGEVALFSSDDYTDPAALLDYVQWGSTPHAFTQLAVDAGLWIITGYAPTTPNAIRLYVNEETNGWIFEESKP